jgi:hypothetical protein
MTREERITMERDLYQAMYQWRGEQVLRYAAVIRCLCDDDPDGARRALLPLLPRDHPAHLEMSA